MSKRQRTEAPAYTPKKMSGKGQARYPPKKSGGQRQAASYNAPYTLYRQPMSETHYVDVVSGVTTPTPISSTATFVCLNGTLEGSGAYNRIGRRINLRSLYLNGRFGPEASITAARAAPTYIRAMVVYDLATNGSTPTLANLLQSETNAGASSNTVFSGNNMSNRGRFQILMDERFVMPTITSAVVPLSDQNMLVQRYIQLRDKVTEYKASTGADTDITIGGLYLVLLSDDTPAYWNFKWSSRVKFRE